MNKIEVLPSAARYRAGEPSRQGGMGATLILFTIALIVLVGAALAYSSRGNQSAINTQGARVYSGVLLKQSADYRDAYSRYIFDGGVASAMTFNATNLPAGDLFYPTTQYGNYQAPPAQAMASGTARWLYNKSIIITGIGSGAADSITYIPDVTQAVCAEVNNQMYGSTTIPTPSGVASTDMATQNGSITIDTTATVGARASGCFQTTDAKYVVYSTLAEN